MRKSLRLFWSYDEREEGPIKLKDLAPNFSIPATGVYIVWLVGPAKMVLFVGSDSSGQLPTLLADLKNDGRIKKQEKTWAFCEVYITWAWAYPEDCAGIQNFLIEELDPEMESTRTDDEPIRVKLPRFLSSSLDT